MTTHETGHAKNVAHFEELIGFCTGYGATYNPAKASIKLAALQTLLTSAKNTITAVNTNIPAFSNAISAREAAFEPLSKLATKIINALKASDTTEQVVGSAMTLIRKIQGRRAKPKTKPTPSSIVVNANDPKAVAPDEPINISASQMSFDNRLDNLDKLIKLLSSVAAYAPNEAELKVTALTTFYNDLKTKNSTVLAAEVPISNARISRNDILYKATTGMTEIAADVKAYIKSLFGATSPQYRQVSGIVFKKY